MNLFWWQMTHIMHIYFMNTHNKPSQMLIRLLLVSFDGLRGKMCVLACWPSSVALMISGLVRFLFIRWRTLDGPGDPCETWSLICVLWKWYIRNVLWWSRAECTFPFIFVWFCCPKSWMLKSFYSQTLHSFTHAKLFTTIILICDKPFS